MEKYICIYIYTYKHVYQNVRVALRAASILSKTCLRISWETPENPRIKCINLLRHVVVCDGFGMPKTRGGGPLEHLYDSS